MNAIFVNMPFASIRPAIGVSLLQAHLRAMGVASRVEYFNMQFARRFGNADYEYIAEHTPSQALAGEWIFSRSAFGRRDDADVAYLQMFNERFGKFPSTRRGLGTIVRARNMVEAFLDECVTRVDWKAFDVVGFTSTFTQNVASLALARRIKEFHPHGTIVFGGANCEAEMGVQLHRSFPFVDFVCSGEADRSLPQLMHALRAGEPADEIPGVIARVEGQTRYVSLRPNRVADLDTLPYPEYDDYFAQYTSAFPASKTRPAVLMESSRGCWWGEKHHCTFCGLNGTSMAFRSKSAQRVLDEIVTLCSRHESTFVEMVDNILDMRYFHDLIPELGRRQLKIGFFYETKANLTKSQVLALCDAGVHSIQPGIESLSSDVLRIMRKGTTAVQNVQLLKWCRELGIKVLWNLIYGFPGEDAAAYESTARIMESISHLQPPFGFSAIRLDRFSPNFTSSEELGLANVRPDRSYAYIYDLPVEELRQIAYYFEYDYLDERDPASYVGAARTALTRWQRAVENRGLIYADYGDKLAVWDFRPDAERTLTILESDRKAVYLYCDQNRSLQQIRAMLAQSALSGNALDEYLAALLRSRLMIHLDERYLSLATKLPGNGPRAPRDRAKAQAEAHLVF